MSDWKHTIIDGVPYCISCSTGEINFEGKDQLSKYMFLKSKQHRENIARKATDLHKIDEGTKVPEVWKVSFCGKSYSICHEGEIMNGNAVKRIALDVEESEVVDPFLTSIPYLIMFETAHRFSFLNIDQTYFFSPVVGIRGHPFIQNENQQGGQEGHGQYRKGEPIEAYSVSLHGRDLTVTGHISAGHQGSQEDGCGKHLRDDHRQFEEKV